MIADAFSPFQLGPVTLKNRIIKAATFEGRTSSHQVNDDLIAFHREFAEGGVAMTTLAYCAVSPDGCGTPNEIVLNSDSISGLTSLASAVHGAGSAINAQIGHAGAVAAGAGYVGRSPSRMFSPLAGRFTKPLSEPEIRDVVRAFGRATAIVAEAGFDCVELHFGHGYLPSEFLSPKCNRRRDQWGGTIENRARLCREIAQAAREHAHGDMAVIAKLNMTDGVQGGLWVDESIRVAKMLESDGHLDALELTAGSSLQNPMFLFRGEVPLREMERAMPAAVRPLFRIGGRFFLKEYPYRDLYLMDMARQFRAELTMPLIALGGFSDRGQIEAAIGDGFDLIAIGRALLRQPDLVNLMEDNPRERSLCIRCNKCMPTIYHGTHCVLRD